MKNARDNRQTQVKNCLKWTASGLLLALMFVLVFAGTLSGAFGIENELQQNGIIQSNVASAADNPAASTPIDISSKFSTTNTNSFNINPDVNKRGKLWTTDAEICENNTWTKGDGATGGTWTIANKNSHSGHDYGCVWFDFDVGNWYGTLSDSVKISVTGVFHTPQNEGGVVGIDSSSSKFGTPTDAKKLYENIRDGKGENGNGANATTGQITGKDKEIPVALEYELKGRYVRVYYMAWDNGYFGAYNFYACTLRNVKVSIERTLKSYTIEYNKNADLSTGTVESTSHKYMEASNVSSGVFSGKDQYFTNWNTSADGSGVAMAIGASTGTSTAANTFGGVVKSNLQNGQTTTTLYAQYKEIPFVFNGTSYATYNPIIKLVVLGNTENYMSSTIDGYDTSIEYKNTAGVTIPQPGAKGNYTATITVKKGGVVRGTRTVEFEVVEGDFGKIQGGTGKWGSVTNPYVISNETHLKNLSAIVNGRDALNSIVGSDGVTAEQVVATDKTYKDCYFVVAADLGADTAIELVPIGKDSTHYFAGTIFGGNDSDANNRTMRTINLNIQQSGVDNVGLFGYVKGASISYIKTAGTIVGGAAVGGLVGYADGVTISNCRNNATVKATGNAATFEGKQGAYLGGFVGYATASVTIKNCYNGGEITTETKWENSNIVGGIVGHLETGGQVSYCYNIGKVVGSDNIGGIAGINNGTVSYCYQDGELNDLYVGEEPSNFITSNGGTISHCWILPGASQTGFNQSTIPNGKKLELFDSNNQKNANMYAPVVVDGNTYIVPTGNWESIVEKDINGFEVFVADTNGNKLLLKKGEYLRSATASDWATTATPTIIDSNATANRNGQTIQNSTEIDIVYMYSATVGNDVFVSHSRIGKTVSNTTYNGQNQDIGNIANLPTDTDAGVFYFEKGNAASTATSNKKDWREGGYVVVVDIKIGDKVVGRDVFDWSIEKKTLTVEDQWTFGLYNNVSVVYNGAQQGLLSFEIKGFVANESVASGNATVALTYTNTDYTLVGSKYTLNVDKSTNEGQYGVSFTLEANNYALDTNATHAFSWTISRKSITIGQSSFYYGTNIEQKLTDGTVFQNLVSGHSVRVDTQKHNFYKQNIGNNQYTILQSDIAVNDNSGQPVTGNYNITGGVIITVLAGDFWSDGTTDIANNPWGSPRNPYVIGKKEQLTRLSSIVGGTSALNSTKSDTYVYVQAQSGDYSGAYFKLADNIPSVGNITPIGSNTHSFAGNFDGNKKTISGLNISVAGNNVGLFGYISGATIKNLTVNGSVKGSSNVGGVVGYALNSTIENVTNNASVNADYTDISYTIRQVDATPVSGGDKNYPSGENAYQINDGNVGTKYCGTKKAPMSFIAEINNVQSIVGFAIQNATDTSANPKRTPKKVTIWGSNNGNEIPSESWGQSGGGNKPTSWSGYTSWVEIYTSDDIKLQSTDNRKNIEFDSTHTYRYYWVYIEGTDKQLQFAEFDFLSPRDNIGGVVGYASDTTITTIANNGSVSGGKNVGGIVGKICAGSVENCINTGAVSATSQAGGIIGNTNGVTVKNCKNEAGGTVTATGNAAVGGIVGGLNDGGTLVIEKCENNAAINASNANGVAGIVGHNPSSAVSITVTSCKNTGVITGSLNVGGIGGRIETTQNERLKLVFRNCYNSAAIYAKRASQYGTVGGIIGYLYANGTTRSDVAVIEYCFSSGYVESTSGINEGGIVGNATSSTRLSVRVSYCYTTNTAHSIAGYSGATISSSYVIMNSDSSTPDTKNDARFFVYNGNKTSYAPAVIVKNGDNITSCTKYAWEDILTTNINGFMVQATVNPGASQYYHTANGTSSTVYIKPDRIENNHIANAENRNDATSFELTAWYASERNGNYYCDVKEIAISDKSTTYNGGNQGFDFGDVTPKNGSVYSISFDYVYNYNGRIETVPNEVGTYDTTVFVKIDGIVVGKKMGAKYTVDKAALNVGWEWTDKLHANLYDRTGNGDKVQFVYNGKAQGLDSVSEHLRDVQLFDVTGNDLINTNAATYTRTYTLKDTRNYKLQNANNNNADLSGTTVTFEWKIRKNKLTVFNRWVAEDFGKDSNLYTFEYNTTHRGLLTTNDAITFLTEKATDNTRPEFKQGTDYTISEHQNAINVGEYSRTVRIINTNYEVNNTTAYVGSSSNATVNKGISVNGLVVTYTWKIVPYSLATNITSGNVWFGGTTNLIVGNQGIANVNVGNQSYADKRFYPLQSEQNGVQKVLVYAQHNYAADKFVLYVKYNNGTVAVLTQGTEYTVGTLDTNNTFGTFVNVVSQADPVVDTNVTASGTGNFSGNITKYYTAMFSDFGWKKDKSPSDEDWGSQDNPYVISTPEHLLRLSQIVNGGMAWNSIQNTVTAGVCIAPQTTAKATSRDYKDAYFLVTANVDMSGYISTDGVYNFLPIGTRSTQNQTELPFSATFDGGDNTITYVYNVGSFYNVDGARTNYVGLFGYLNGATISNLKVASNGGLSITDNDGIVGIEYVGGIAGCGVDSTLYNTVLAYGGWVRGENYVGGIVGYGERITIESSEAVSSANVGGETYVGGIVGKWIVSNQNQIGGSVAGQRYVTPADQTDVMGIKYVGGIAGWMDTSSCATTISYAPQLNNNGKEQNLIVVGGIEYVGALFGAFIGNGYHQNATNDKYTAIVIDKDASDKFKVGNVKVLLQKLKEKSASGNAKVVGGLVGYAEGVGILFNTDWTTSNVTLDTGNYTPSFIGGIAGVLGKNATIEAIYQLKNDGTFLTGGTHTITHSVPDEQKTFGTAAKPLGSFVGGIVGYVSSQAGVYWETGTTIFGNGISLVNSVTIYATSYAGGIFGALGDLSTSVASSFESDTDSILYKVLTTGVREGSASTTLGLAPTVDSNGITAQGRLVNNASISVSGSYVGGIAGYGGAKVRFVLRNTPQDSAIDVSKLNIYSGGSDIFINGSYAGGIAGYLADNLEHELQYIVVQAKFESVNAKRVGGLVGYMGSGKVERCVVTSPDGTSPYDTSPDGTISATTDNGNYQGAEYVGGLVGETQNATIRNSVSTGFNLEKTSNTKGGLLGGGTNPTIESSWTFYIAKSGATYQTVSKNTYGKYILVDTAIVTTNGSSYPAFAKLCEFTGITKNGTAGVLEFAVNVPSQRQLVFYNASGSDTETSNKESFKGFDNSNNVLTIKLDMASGTCMQICVVDIKFVNVPQSTTSNDDPAKEKVKNAYVKPSNDERYHVEVTQAIYETEGTKPTYQVTHIKANIYFDYDGDGHYISIGTGNVEPNNRIGGEYDSGEIIPGSSAENPLTISSQEEWNDFAWSIYTGANDYEGKYVKLLKNITIEKKTEHKGTKVNHNFASVSTPNSYSEADPKNANSNMGYNFAGNISQGSEKVKIVTVDGVQGATTPSFKGHFDGNGNTITIDIGNDPDKDFKNRISAFPNAGDPTITDSASATQTSFKNLTVAGKIVVGTMNGSFETFVDCNNGAYDVAGFVGKPFGAIKFENCTNTATIQGLRTIAGIAGCSTLQAPITLIGCVNKGDITSYQMSEWKNPGTQDMGNQDDYQYGTGGLIAFATSSVTIESCTNFGDITGAVKVGGLVGRVTNYAKSGGKSVLTINNCANIGKIRSFEYNKFNNYYGNEKQQYRAANVWARVGGLVGEVDIYTQMFMYASYNSGEIRALGNVAGGLVGIIGSIPDQNKPEETETIYESQIAYCYNTGKIFVGYENTTNPGHGYGGIKWIPLFGSGTNWNGTEAGGILGVSGNVKIDYCYNVGDITAYGCIGKELAWHSHLGGIIAEVTTNTNNTFGVGKSKAKAEVSNCYNVGLLATKERSDGTQGECRYSADIIGYQQSKSNNIKANDCYGVKNQLLVGDTAYFDGWNSTRGSGTAPDVALVRTGTTLNSLADLTAYTGVNGTVAPTNGFGDASTATIGAQGTTDYENGTLGGYVYVYGCLPQLAVFAVDTYNGLSMNSQNFGKDIYGEYKAQKAGEKYSPYVIRDGIDLMGVQTLVGLGYTFENEYIEFANGSNNITLDKNLSSDVAKAINMPISNSTSTKIADSENAYKSLGKDNTYHIGKSYHLFKLSAVCYDDNVVAENTAYQYWLSNNHYYNGAYGNKEGAYKNYGTFKTQNILTIGRNGKVFKGSISGKQETNANTVINNLRITSGQTIGGAYGGLFGHVENAYIGYIEVGGESNIWAYSSDNQQIAATGAIAGYVTGDSIIEHCAVSGTTAIGAYGKNDDTHIASDITYAGGIVGLTDPKQGSEYKAGISAIIKGCTVNISTTTGDRAAFAGMIVATKSNIGGVLGYVGGDAGASGKSNTVRIEGCSVDKAVIQAASSANTSSQIGGILGYGSQYVAAFITGCKVGVGGAVSIKGEHSLGGIAGGMSNAKGGYIDSCTVGANTTIERIAVGNDNTVLESPKHGTAIGGLVGFTQDSKDDTSPLTTTFSGTSAFNGTITVSVEATNPSTDSDGKISCIGGIVGDMGSGANFASGSNVTVGGNINITLAAANVGGVVGRTNKATFIGKFNVAPNMSTENAENVGGFIGKNIGTVYILADTTDKLENTTVGALNGTEITIGGKIKGTSEVGGFIGVNNSGSTLNIGSNVANAKPYKSGTLTITITASVTGSGNNVGGIVGKNEGDDENTQDNDYATIDIVKGTIEQNGAIIGANNVGGIIGLNDGLLTTGGGEADTTIGGVTLSEEQQNKIKNLSINNTGSVTGTGDYVGGVVGKLDSPSALRTEDSGKGAIAGTFTNSGNVSGGKFVGGSLGYVGKNVTITAKNNVATLFVNDGQVTATGYYAGGSIGVLVGKIEGVDNGHTVNFKNTGTVTATGFVGGSIGVLAGPVKYAQFVNSSGNLSIAAVNAVGGSVGFIGVPTPLETILTGVGITLADDYVKVENTHFEASGELTANPDSNAISVAKDAATNKSTGWGGVGGAIGVIGKNVRWGTEQNKNTYYANGNVTANGINNVGGIVGIILAENVNISNMLAYNTTVKGGENVGGIVGATDGIGTVITSAYAIEGTFTGSKNVGGIIGLAKTDTDASTSYWVKGYANSDIATYDVKDLSKLGFTTGKAETGWFFLYANDANGANGLGTINTSHSTNSDLQYWKRIADAYTASEREKGLDKTDLKSNIVYGGGSPQLSTLYATATAAEVNSQYYMYTATSNEAVKPQVEFDDTRNGYFISVKTNDQDAAGNKRQAQNVAVFYRKITKGSDLTYNGYARNAVVGMDGVGLLEQTPDETTVYDETYRNKYFYTTSTSVDGTTATTAMSDPNTYKSTIKIYFFDGKGKARIVGGIDDLEWTIKARELSAMFKVATNRKYGEDSNGSEGENKYDMFVSISNIAPNRGKQVPIKLDVSVGNDIVVTFTWDGTVFKPSKAGSGITLSSIGMIPSEAMKDSDTMFIAEEQTDGLNTQVLNCYLVFTEAKAYTVTINTSDVVAKPRYTIKNEEATGNFTVSPAELRLERTSGGSHAFDNTSTHGAVWKITGFVYEDGFKQLAQFNPVFHSNGQTENMYDSGGLKNNINFTNGSVVQATQTDGVNKTITITLSTVRTLGDYYIEFNAGKVGENKYRVGNYELSFVKGQNEYHIVKTTISISSNLTSANNKKVYNQKTSVITVTFTASAAGDPSFSGISNFEEFLTRFFAVKDTAKFSKVDIPTSSNDVKKTVTWTFTTKADAESYVIELIEGKDHVAEEANCAHVPDKLPTYTYTINRRPITLSATKTPLPTGKTNYVYNTKHQGIDEVFVNQGSQSNEIGLLSGDRIKISVRINGSTESTLTFQDKYSQAAGVSTINANTYTASFSLSGNNNYTQSSSSLSWTIEQYVVKVGAFSLGSGKTYDGTAVTPTITIVGISGSNGTYTYENDTFTLTYSIEKDGGSAYESGKLVNAGTYKIKVGGTNGKIVARRAKGTSTGSDTSNNYKFDSSNSTADYTINACPIAIEWNYPTLVYTGNNQNITIKSITVNGTAIAMTSNSVKSGLGNDVLTFTLSGGGVNAGSYTTKAELSSVSGTNEGVDSVVGNYTPKLFTSDSFTIVKSKVGIRYNGGTANKVYDANENVKDNNFTFAVYSTNFGASGNDDLFSIKMLYDNKNVSNGYTKTINFAYTFKATNTNYELDASTATSQAVPNVGQITPAHIKVALNKLRSGKATRTYTDDEFYGGADGATGNGRSKTYRTGEGFTVSGVLGSDNINVVARYQEADNTRNSNSGNYFDFSKYVNDVYKDADGTFKKASTPTYFKKLVFTMTGTDAANYTFNVYDSSAEGGNKYSESDSTAAAIQSVTVYDSRDSKNNKNASGAASIQIEITVKSVRVEYSDTAQSYANDDNTYNTDWKPITGTNKDMDKADAKIKVSNGWMYADGKDHTAEEGYTKREYRGYTTIRGSQNSERLGAKVDPTNGMDLNYRLSNQPTLTIAYFVSTGDEYEINSLARLLIASFYYTASQNPGNLEIIKIVSSGYKWVSVVSADDYDKGEFKLPQDTPITDSKATTWDEYFTELEAKGYSVFLNIEANAQDNIPANTWGYYATTTSKSSTIPTSYKLTKDIVGKFTESDISILNTFFTVIGDDGKTTTSTWSGNGTYLKNVLKAAEGKIATINGSLFVSTAKAEGATAITGFDGTFDGNGYVIEYLNIMGYGKENVGLFDVIGANGIVKNLHLRNVTINGNAKYVGGIAGKVLAAADALTEKSVKNVSFHGSINVTGSTDQSVGGLFGISERAVENAIVLGSITVSNENAKVGGVVGSSEQGMSNVVSLMQIDANCNVGAFSQTNTNVTNSYHLQNAVWRRNGISITFVNHDNAKTYDELMLGSNSLYSNGTSESGTYDVIKETFADSGQNANPRQSKRLRDMVSVYLLMYSLSVNNGKYTISSSSWLVGTADGTSENAIFIANKQNVSLLRELRFASFTLKANVSIEIASTFSGAFYGSVTSATNESGTSYGYKITCDKAMFEAYTNNASAWLSVQQ